MVRTKAIVVEGHEYEVQFEIIDKDVVLHQITNAYGFPHLPSTVEEISVFKSAVTLQ